MKKVGFLKGIYNKITSYTDKKLWNKTIKIVMDYANPEQKTEFLKLCEENKAFTLEQGKYYKFYKPTNEVQEIITNIK